MEAPTPRPVALERIDIARASAAVAALVVMFLKTVMTIFLACCGRTSILFQQDRLPPSVAEFIIRVLIVMKRSFACTLAFLAIKRRELSGHRKIRTCETGSLFRQLRNAPSLTGLGQQWQIRCTILKRKI